MRGTWLALSVLALSTNAFAILNETEDGNAVNTSGLQAATQSCDTTCNQLIDPSSQQIIGIYGQDGWGTSDDQWCANHNAQTNPGVLSNNPTAATGTTACNVPLLAGDGTCAQVNQMLIHCQLHGSQLETQCLAYIQAKGVSAGENIILTFDVAATATCTAACASQWTPMGGAAMVKACNYTGIAASGAEVIQTLTSQQSTAGKMIGALTGGIGLAKSVGGLRADGGYNLDKNTVTTPATPGTPAVPATNGVAPTAATPGTPAVPGTPPTTVNGVTTPGTVGTPGVPPTAATPGTPANPGSPAVPGTPAGTSTGYLGANGKPTVQDQNGNWSNGTPVQNQAAVKKAEKQACYSAIVFGAMTGIRAYSMHSQSNTKTQACNAVQQLATNAFNPSFAVTTNTAGSTTTGVAGSGSTTGSVVSTQSVPRTPAAMLSNGNGYCTTAAACASALTAATSGPTGQAATDGGLLTSSGLAQQLAPLVASLPQAQMAQHVANGGSADQLVQSALAGQGGSFGAGIAALAKAAQQDAANMSGAAALASTPIGGGGMAGGQAKSAADENPFKLLGQNENLGGQNNANFTKGPALNGAEIGQDGDIYHTSFSGSIFDIVSHKIEKTRDRVDNLNYTIPLNRAIAGEK